MKMMDPPGLIVEVKRWAMKKGPRVLVLKCLSKLSSLEAVKGSKEE